MSDREHSTMMLVMAEKDLKALRGMLDSDTFEDEVFGFHAQQTVEKALKAWLSLIGADYPKTHDIEELLAILGDHGIQSPPRFSELTNLTDFAVQFRYEAFEGLGAELDRAHVLGDVSDLVAHVRGVLETAGPETT